MENQSHIAFHFEDAELHDFSAERIRRWIEEVIEREGGRAGTIQYIFCSDDYLHRLHRQFMSRDDYTDIITFNYNEDLGYISGDIFISLDRVKENAALNKKLFHEELYRVVIHGILHLLGYNDQEIGERAKMREKENYCLSLLS